MKWILLVALMAATLAGCSDSNDAPDPDNGDGDGGDGDDGNTTMEPEVLEKSVQLTGLYPVNIAYTPDPIRVASNMTVKVTFTNTDTNPAINHDWVLEDVEGAATSVIANGESDSVTFVTPEPGTYTFFCSVGSHRDQGMEGSFIVE